jgi:hypothetical protein
LVIWYWFFVGPALLLAVLSLRGERKRAAYVERRLAETPHEFPPVSVIVPVKGPDHELRENLAARMGECPFVGQLPSRSKPEGHQRVPQPSVRFGCAINRKRVESPLCLRRRIVSLTIRPPKRVRPQFRKREPNSN